LVGSSFSGYAATRDLDGFWLMGAIATLVGLLSHGLVDTVWYRPQINTLWWLMIALIASYYTLPTETKEDVRKTEVRV
jgi:putative inorganic carbon (HCO3(-)) transporter